MAAALPWIQIVLSVLLIVLVLLQRSEGGLGSAFGGGGSSDAVEYQRRGAEKTLFRLTILVGVLFCISALVSLFS